MTKRIAVVLVCALIAAWPLAEAEPQRTAWTLAGYNNLGMHCMDSDYAVFSVLPPYNTIHAQLTDPSGRLVRDPGALGIAVTYQAVADPAGSINTTSAAKTNFWAHLPGLFGVSLPVDQGLSGNPMPGVGNAPHPMTWDAAQNWWIALGIPITPYDDAARKNPYPMFHLVARDSSGNVLATTDVVLPVSDEMDCSVCHASGAGPEARPSVGWAWNANAERDYRLNVLLKHDERFQMQATYQGAAAATGYSRSGLYQTVTSQGKAILCAACHASEALGTSGQPGCPPLTSSVHAMHASVTDPTNGQTLDASTNRTACYRCHPGAATRCLRGAMGRAVSPDGSMAMQCQSCHGSMSRVGVPTRTGWLEEPACQSCHTGPATHNNGQIRYTNVFDPVTDQPRAAVDGTFATNPDVPLPGHDLYRFSFGHGAVACQSCHGSTHAEFPTSQVNDNVQSANIQGHPGMLVECDTCHVTQPVTATGGPHGMHPVGQSWVIDHHDVASDGQQSPCRMCHGTDYRGTVLSRAQADRVLSTGYGTKSFFRGGQISCYACHNGPTSDDSNPNRAPLSTSAAASTTANVAVATNLVATDADLDPLIYRIVSQAGHGTVALSGHLATYLPDEDYVGPDAYTFAAWDGMTDSNLATVTVVVASNPCALTCSASAPPAGSVNAAIPFQASSNAPGCGGAVAYDWNFGDGQPHAASAAPTHTYFTSDTFAWAMTASAGASTCEAAGTIRVVPPLPAPVPSYLTRLSATTSDHGASLTIGWDAANCPSTSYQILYGYGSQLPAWTVAGARCAVGTSGSYLWSGVPDPSPDSSRLLWFLVVGTDGALTEGSWGRTSSGIERGGANASGRCGVTSKNITQACGAR
ncbi:MAG TPA: PKD domain-containing protein [Candidatus Polarisedimenticolaceae bacterium]|nr:PKD domain-containing protein [Candidatus Polarisedimenticolaceae bacterium]